MSHGDHGGGGDNSTTMDHGGMAMFFHVGESATILFEFWKTSDIGSLIGSMVIIFFLAISYEAIKFYREYLHRSYFQSVPYNTITVPVNNGNQIRETKHVVRMQMLSGVHFAQTLLHVIQFVISYFLMLIFMTYNVWLCLAVAFGAGVGYFLFAWQRSVIVDITEHCH
jgi:copper transporter 1